MRMLKVVAIAIFVTLATSVAASDSPAVKCVAKKPYPNHSLEPTPTPTAVSTPEPTTEKPTPEPTAAPTPEPTTEEPTPEPTAVPTPEPTTEECDTCKNVEYIKCTSVSFVGKQASITSHEECCELCRRTPDCIAFMISDMCRLVDEFTSADFGMEVGVMPETDTCDETLFSWECTSEQVCSAATASKSQAFTGTTLSTLRKIASVDDCCAACTLHSSCVGFNYHEAAKECYLYSEITDTMADSAYTTGFINGCPAN